MTLLIQKCLQPPPLFPKASHSLGEATVKNKNKTPPKKTNKTTQALPGKEKHVSLLNP